MLTHWSVLFCLCCCVLPWRASAEEGGDRLAQIETRLERIENLLEKLANARDGGGSNTKTGDKELDAAIERAEKRYGLGGVAATLQGSGGAQASTATISLHRQVLQLLYENSRKTKPDADLLAIVRALLLKRATDFGSVYGAQALNTHILYGPLLFGEPAQGVQMTGGPKMAEGELGRAMGAILVECLASPALERLAAGEAHLFPADQVLPALQKAYDGVSANETARRQRLHAALAACGDQKALAGVRAEVDKLGEETKDYLVFSRYAQVGKPFGLYAMAKQAEQELRKENRAVAGPRRGYQGYANSGYQIMQLCGRQNEYSTAYQQAIANMTDEEKKDTKRVQELYQDMMRTSQQTAIQWVFDKYDKLVWDADSNVFMAK